MYVKRNAGKLITGLILLCSINGYAMAKPAPAKNGIEFIAGDGQKITKNSAGKVYISGDSKNIKTHAKKKGVGKNGKIMYDPGVIEIELQKDLKDINSITNNGHKYEFKDGKISGLSDGEISATSNEAVTGRQLFNVNESVNNVAALAHIPQVSSDKLFSIGVGTAVDHNKRGAFALGVSGQDKTRTFIYKLGVGVSGQNRFNVGFGFNINLGSINTTSQSDDILKLRIKKLEEIVKKLSENKDDAVNDRVISLENRVEKLENKPVVTNDNTLNELLFVIDNFDFDKATLNDENRSALDKILNIIPKNRKAIVIGHTDTEGDFKYNLKLGLKRAKTVANILKENGIEVIEVKSKGYSEIKETNKENRSVEILIK